MEILKKTFLVAATHKRKINIKMNEKLYISYVKVFVLLIFTYISFLFFNLLSNYKAISLVPSYLDTYHMQKQTTQHKRVNKSVRWLQLLIEGVQTQW